MAPLYISLPQEILEMICMFSEQPLIAIAIRSPFIYKALTRGKSRNSMSVALTMKELIITKNKADLVWLIDSGCEHKITVLKEVIIHSPFDFFKEFSEMVGLPVDKLNPYFIFAVRSLNLDTIDYFLEDLHFCPDELGSCRFLKKSPLILQHLGRKLPMTTICQSDLISIAMESNNVLFLRGISNRFNEDIRSYIKDRDLLIAVHKGHLETLKWFHEICGCRLHHYAVCMLPQELYHASLRSRFPKVQFWFEQETNCTLHISSRYGFPGRLSWFY